MNLYLEVKNKSIYNGSVGLSSFQREGITILYSGLEESVVSEIFIKYKDNNHFQFINDLQHTLFFIFLIDEEKKRILVINDKMSSNEIFYTKNNQGIFVSNSTKEILEKSNTNMEVDMDSVYEIITYFSIVPPKTIYKNISSVPLGGYLDIDCNQNEIELREYWKPEDFFIKEMDYSELENGTRNSLVAFFRDNKNIKNSTIALSSGVDSGGMLSMIKSIYGETPESITLGPYGATYKDMMKAKEMAKRNDSTNHAILPSLKDLPKIKEYVLDLNQPIDAGLLFGNSLIFEKTKELGYGNAIFGFGAEMMLGNLKISRVAYSIYKVEKLVPFFILKPIYRVMSIFKSFSKNQQEFLLNPSWFQRFLRARGPLFVHEKKYFKSISDNFVSHFESKAEKILSLKKLDILDKMVLLYIYSWVNYMQYRDLTAMGRKYGVNPILPFDDESVMRAFFKTPNIHRKRNDWNKQLIRDMFKPYVGEDMQKIEVGSLIIPYNSWFKDNYVSYIAYLKSNKIISKAVDLDMFEKDYNTVPESGLILMRMLGVAIWYDSSWDMENLKIFDSICSN